MPDFLENTLALASVRLNISPGYALIGNESGEIKQAGKKGWYWARENEGPNRYAPATLFELGRNAQVPTIVNTVVKIIWEDGRFVIGGLDANATRAQGGDPSSTNHSDPNSTIINKERLYPFFCIPKATTSEPFVVRVYPDTVITGGVSKIWPVTDIDLSGELPAVGTHQYTIVSWIASTASLEVASSTPQADSVALDNTDLQEALDGLSVGSTALWAYVMDGDDSLLSATNSLDVRPIFNTESQNIVNTTRVTTSPYAVVPFDNNIFVDTDGGAITINLPAGVNGRNLRIINSGSSGNDYTLVPNGADLLAGVNSSVDISDGTVMEFTFETTEGWW